jgi:polyvinyl alcohol dehydrogenase (cytochrome)
MRRRILLRTALLAVALAAVVVAPGSGSAAATCAPTATSTGDPWPGGEWRSYGHDLENTRSQPGESVIGIDNVRDLAPAWVFATSDAVADGGGFSNTPVVADGCVYLASNTGWVFALNADTGEVLWSTRLHGEGQTLVGGVIVGSPTVVNGLVFLGVSQPGAPYVAVLDQATGEFLWSTVVETGQPSSFINAGPVYFDDMILQGFAGYEGNTEVSRGGFAILDAGRECDTSAVTVCSHPIAGASGGTILAHQHTIPDDLYAEEFRGASFWCTPSLDVESRYAYGCGGNPHSEGREAPHANSLLKIDLDRNRPTFGTIVDHYKGNVDQYYPGIDKQPVCENFRDETTVLVWSLGCFMLDLDFGGSPNLFRDPQGRLVVGDLQKSGVYHAAYADDMTAAWNAVVGVPCFSCNGTSGAFDGERIYTVGTPPSQLVGLDAKGGAAPYKWVTPILDIIHYQAVSTANGVVYVMDNLGSLNAVDAATGVPLLKRPLTLDTGGRFAADPGGSAGVSVARNTVYAASNEFVVAYKLGGGDGGGPALPGLPSLPGPGRGLPVVAGPGSVGATYLTPVALVQADAPALSFLNLDLAQHDVDHSPAPGQPKLFDSALIGTGQTTAVNFIGPLEAGATYDYYCSIHPNMFGKLIAQ